MADTRVVPVSSIKYGLKAETSFGVALDSSGNDGTAYLTQPVVQTQKPTFNISRESRLLSGRGSVKNAADTVVNTKGGTVTMPFEMLATPRTLAQHALLVGQESGTSGSTVHEMEIDGTSNADSIGGTISSGIPHSCNLAYYPATGEGIKVTGVVCSDLTIAGDVGANNGLVTISGNYFSGFSNTVSTATVLEQTFDGTWVDSETQYYNVMDASALTLDVEGNANQTFIMKSFSFNIANGVNRVGFDTNGNAEVYVFPEYAVTGSLVIKYDSEFDYGEDNNVIQDFLDGDTLSLVIKIGDGTISSEGEMHITAEIQYTGDPAQDLSESGVFHTLEFECVKNGSTEAFKLESFKNEAVTVW
ncbi:MAG: hypothetical protein Unbinned202contig1002_16 [Prokaryotic dsDNA virus sp.]|nr:MAG: hypothetical protein Unbinned202contig1002_16 [Prokaryotic dsDNA virus sp.]|tara:strand:+ start:3811 stop:4890 length:1080 start_codon:yes stop_codon:yes gene_type:complete